MTEFAAVGKSTRIIDGHAKLTGALRYAPDLTLPGMLHARFVQSIYAHANILRIDRAAALEVPGVVAVLTADDLPNITPKARNRLMLARDRVIFAGQPIALVVADSPSAAQDGAERVHIEYEPLAAVTTIDEALAENAPLVWPKGIPKGSSDAGAHGADTGDDDDDERDGNICHQKVYAEGDVEAAFAQADLIVERIVTTPMVHQSSLETHGMIVQPDPVTGGATIWSSTQSPFAVREEVAECLGVAESDVRVIGTPVGGAFGGKIVVYEALAALAARAVGRPLSLILTRSEEISATNPAPAMRVRARLGARNDGTLVAMDGEVYVDAGCYPMNLAKFSTTMLGSFYPVANYRLSAVEVLTFKQSVGAYRAPSAPTLIFAIDCLMDEIAQQLKIDPIELRLKNAAAAGMPRVDSDDWPTIGAHQALEALRVHPAWANREQARAKGRGVGIALGGWPGGTEPAAAVCSLDRNGVVQIHVGSVDISGTATGFSLIAAEAFGVSPDKVRVVISDTQTAPYSGYSAGSKVTFTTGAAVLQAAREARQQALAIAAEEFEAAVEDLEIVDGRVQVRGFPNKSVPLGELAKKSMGFDEKYPPIYGRGRVAETTSAPGFSAQLAEVEVDRETGEVTLHRLVAVQDVGRAINPLAIQGQMMGGATQGVGWALYEQMEYDDQGQLLSGSWMDYALPDITQAAPVIETVIIEVPSDNGPLGVRGVGEPPVVPTAAAIANAIADATGVRPSNLPMTAPSVLAALREAGVSA